MPGAVTVSHTCDNRSGSIRFQARARDSLGSTLHRWLSRDERAHLVRGHTVATSAELATFDFLDQNPDVGPHVVAVDGSHRVGDAADKLLLLLWGNGILHERSADERHSVPPRVAW